jgi:hypothetical protein
LSDITISKILENIIDLEDFYICLDRGFYGIEEIYKAVLPFKGVRKEFYSDKHKEYDNEHKKIRITIENFFAALKKFLILRDKFRYNGTLSELLEKHHLIFINCVNLFNKIYPNGLRTNDDFYM